MIRLHPDIADYLDIELDWIIDYKDASYGSVDKYPLRINFNRSFTSEEYMIIYFKESVEELEELIQKEKDIKKFNNDFEDKLL